MWQGEASKTNDRPVLVPKVKAGLLLHHPRYIPCSASALLHHTFNSCLLPACSNSKSLGQSSTPSPPGPTPTFHLPSQYPPLQTVPTIWPLPLSPSAPWNSSLMDLGPYFKVQPKPHSSSCSHSRWHRPFLNSQSILCLHRSLYSVVIQQVYRWLQLDSDVKPLRNMRRWFHSTPFICSKDTKPEWLLAWGPSTHRWQRREQNSRPDIYSILFSTAPGCVYLTLLNVFNTVANGVLKLYQRRQGPHPMSFVSSQHPAQS